MFFFRKRKKKKKFVVCANCQGDALIYFLKKIPEINDEYEFISITNYILINKKQAIPYKKLQSADVFLYQPVDPIHGKYSTKSLSEFLRPECIRISFPYIYNNGFWPFYLDHANGHMNQVGVEILSFFDGGVIRSLKETGKTNEEILADFENNQIDFNYPEKFKRSLSTLRTKESELDIRVADFIEQNYKTQRLFYNFQHPKAQILGYVVGEILKKIGIRYAGPIVATNDYYHYDGKYLPILPDVQIALGLDYADDGGKKYFYNMLKAVLDTDVFEGFDHNSAIRKEFYNKHFPLSE